MIDPAQPLQLPLEARDFGMYVGFIVTWGYLVLIGRGRAKGMPRVSMLITLIIFVGTMGFDGVNAFLYDMPFLPHLYTPLLQLRLATGLLCGMAFTGFLVPVVNYALWRGNDMRPLIGDWKQFFVMLGLLVVLFILNETRLGLLYYPLAFVTSASTLILIALINLVFVVSITGRDGSALTFRDALNPFAIAVVLAIVELGLLSLMRYAVLGTTVLP